jgi:hypothetical protein
VSFGVQLRQLLVPALVDRSFRFRRFESTASSRLLLSD